METTNLLLPSTRVAGANEWKREAEDAVLITEQTHKRSPFIEANTTEVTLEHLRTIVSYPPLPRTTRYVYHIQVSSNPSMKRPETFITGKRFAARR